MKQFKGLMIKEWNTYKNLFLIPVWITALIYVLMIAGMIYGYYKQGTVHLNQDVIQTAEQANIIFYFVSTIISLIPYGLMIFFTGTIITNMMNDDFKNKCAIFHLAQPVSLIKIIGAKLALLFSAGFVISFAIALFNQIVFSIGFNIYSKANVMIGFLALFQTSLISIFPTIFACTFFMMSAALFIKKPGIIIPILLVTEVVINIINNLWNTTIPSLVSKLIYLAVGKTTVNVFDNNKLLYQKTTNGDYSVLTQSIQEMWLNLFDIVNVWRILLSIVFIIIAYFLYKRRDIV
ncbi:MAG TPA: hypothetical protein PK816_09535 [Candidatus Cloacimonadota bacterium]|nr:hypothetical protein [Candidatus Cloacimonadota bacterium]